MALLFGGIPALLFPCGLLFPCWHTLRARLLANFTAKVSVCGFLLQLSKLLLQLVCSLLRGFFQLLRSLLRRFFQRLQLLLQLSGLLAFNKEVGMYLLGLVLVPSTQSNEEHLT